MKKVNQTERRIGVISPLYDVNWIQYVAEKVANEMIFFFTNF